MNETAAPAAPAAPADYMAPAASPGEWSKKSGGRRVNNLPMYLFGGVVLMFLIVMALVAVDRAAKQNAPADGPKEKIGTTSMFAGSASEAGNTMVGPWPAYSSLCR